MLYVDRLPAELLGKLKNLDQPIKWHPEKTVYNHIFLVEKEARKYNDINLEICAVFHDLGKIDAEQVRQDKETGEDKTVFYGHEFYATGYIRKYKHLFDDLDVNWDIVEYVTRNHMRSHILDQMRPHKRQAIMGHEYWPYLLKFSDCDNNGRLPEEEIEGLNE